MEELYSIGETAKLNDVSIKSLRHYDEIGLLKPRYIDPETGYRYYCYSQFSFIDKIKRYKNIGMSLKELRDLFQSQDLSRLAAFLEEQKQMLDEEERLLQEKRQDVQWLADFFAYSKGLAVENDISIKEFPAMTMICVPCQGDDSMYAMDMELRRITVSPEFRSCQILNPYGYILDFDHLLKNEMYPSASTVCVRDAPDDSPECRSVDCLLPGASVPSLPGSGLRIPEQPVRPQKLSLRTASAPFGQLPAAPKGRKSVVQNLQKNSRAEKSALLSYFDLSQAA